MNKLRLITSASAFVFLFFAGSVLAERSLVQSDSQINFISIKNEHIAESHSFDLFTGTVSDTGNLEIVVDLSSVNTLIPIRNERMQKMLFKVGAYPKAIFKAQIEPSLLNTKAGEKRTLSVAGSLKVQEKTIPLTFDLVIIGLSGGAIQAATVKPVLLSTTSLGLDDGVKALQEIAMLKSISKTVPVSFKVVFAK